MRVRLIVVVLLAAAAWLLWRCAFIVGEGQYALVTHFGRITAAGLAPGLHWKSPLDDAYRFDARLRTRAYQGETLLSGDGKTLSADFYLRWRILDGVRYFQAAGGDADIAAARIADVVRDRIKAQATRLTAAQLAASPRAALTDPTFRQINAALAPLGVGLEDVELQGVDLPDDAAKAVYERMQESFAARAQQLRAGGDAAAGQIRMQAERRRAEVLADGVRDAQRIRADADRQAGAAYARAYGRNPEFAAFYRSLQAYRDALGRDGDIFVLSPDSEFFKYLRSASGR
jgi:modulator of FtsH protease HflC